MKKDIPNQKFGRLTVKEVVWTVLGKGNIWRCEYECGGEKEVPAAYLLNGHTRSCGYMNAERKARLDILKRCVRADQCCRNTAFQVCSRFSLLSKPNTISQSVRQVRHLSK